MNTTQTNTTVADNATLNGDARATDVTNESGATMEEEQGPAENILEELEQQETSYEFDALEKAAFEWASTPLIPATKAVPYNMAEAPLFYTGYDAFMRAARKLDRPLALWEAQYMVQLDGPLAICQVSKRQFQPVKFFSSIPKDLAEQYKQGKRLSAKNPLIQVELQFAGCYYLNPQLDPAPLSGALFAYDGERYWFDKTSPLGLMARTLHKNRWRRKYGDCLAVAKELSEARKKQREMQKKVDELAAVTMNRRARNHSRN